MTPQPPPHQAPQRLLALDGLRLVAALLVVFHHWVGQGSGAWETPTPKLFEGLHPYIAYGWMGVQLFFIISGFVICMSSWDRSLGEFFVSRVARLYPAYWFGVLATTAAVHTWPQYNKVLPWEQVLANLTMLEDPLHVPFVDTVYWTLSVELRFYVLFALAVVWRGITYRRAVLFCVLWTIGSMVASATGEGVLNFVLMPEFSMYFVAGIAIYLMHRFRPTPLLWGIVAISWVLAQHGLAAKVKEMSGYVSRPLEWSTATELVTLFFALVLAVSRGWFGWLRGRALMVAGSLTYPLYLMHMVIGWTLIHRFHNGADKWQLLLGLLGAMLLLAWLVHRMVEQPLGALLKRWLAVGIAEAGGAGAPGPARLAVVAAPAEPGEAPAQLGAGAGPT